MVSNVLICWISKLFFCCIFCSWQLSAKTDKKVVQARGVDRDKKTKKNQKKKKNQVINNANSLN